MQAAPYCCNWSLFREFIISQGGEKITRKSLNSRQCPHCCGIGGYLIKSRLIFYRKAVFILAKTYIYRYL
jgi:hypothetical protein